MLERKMTDQKNENNSAPQAKGDAKETKPATKQVVASFDKLSENDQMAVLERIASEKNPQVDSAFLFETLRKNGIEKIPNEKIIKHALAARREFAEGTLTVLKSKQAVVETYNMAIADGYSPLDARKLVIILVTQNGKILSDRSVRRYLPEEAKHTEKAHSPTEGKTKDAETGQFREKTEEEKAGIKQLICPPAMCQAIAEYGAKNQSCLIFHDGKKVTRVKAAVVTETPKPKGGNNIKK